MTLRAFYGSGTRFKANDVLIRRTTMKLVRDLADKVLVLTLWQGAGVWFAGSSAVQPGCEKRTYIVKR